MSSTDPSTKSATIELPPRLVILRKLQAVNEELQDMTSRSYSQSNCGYMLALRSLRSQRDRLLKQLEASTI